MEDVAYEAQNRFLLVITCENFVILNVEDIDIGW